MIHFIITESWWRTQPTLEPTTPAWLVRLLSCLEYLEMPHQVTNNEGRLRWKMALLSTFYGAISEQDLEYDLSRMTEGVYKGHLYSCVIHTLAELMFGQEPDPKWKAVCNPTTREREIVLAIEQSLFEMRFEPFFQLLLAHGYPDNSSFMGSRSSGTDN